MQVRGTKWRNNKSRFLGFYDILKKIEKSRVSGLPIFCDFLNEQLKYRHSNNKDFVKNVIEAFVKL